MKNNKSYLFIGVGALLLGSFLLGIKFYKDSQKEKFSFMAQNNAETFVRKHSPRLGSPDARVYLVEFLDPECESCRQSYPLVKDLLSKYNGKVQLIVRYAAFHGNSKTAIAAVEAAKKQEKYWEALGLLFETQPQWGSHHNPQIDLIFDFLPQVGIDVKKLKADMLDEGIAKIIDQDMTDLKTLGIRGTPTFFVNGKKPGDYNFQALSSLVAQEVEAAYPQ
jgi:protein-disulfide isomerase